MGASFSTPNMRLSQWTLENCPEMHDFNDDNLKIDQLFTQHIKDNSKHIRDDIIEKLEKPFECIEYFGTGIAKRTFDLPFVPSYVRILSTNKPQSMIAGDTTQIFSADIYGSFATKGASISGETLTVVNNATADSDQTLVLLNRNGVNYLIVAFR